MEESSSLSDNQSDIQEQIQNTDTQLYITDSHQYLSWANKDKKIKVMDQCNPIMPHVYLKDISLHKKGPLEDKIYSKFDKYYWNIRRGNTLCQIYNQKQEEVSLFMCRRGMKKFYDLEPQYLKTNRNLKYGEERFRKRIFQKLDNVVGNGCKIHLYSIFKENGQHCQISYVHALQYWLFASKNVTILAKTVEDLDNHYIKQRFYWAKLIGRQFFKMLQQFTAEQTNQFIQDIKGKTLLGEHCGYQQHQHITKYQQIQIIFYGLVDNQGFDHCLPVDTCQRFLKKYGLKMSRTIKKQNLTNKNEVYQTIYKMLKETAQGTMEQNGQGSVLYIVSEQIQSKKQRTIGMCKLKTSQYLIFRRIRQMLKIFFAKKGITANNFEKFKFDIQNMSSSYFKPPLQLNYYQAIAKEAFKQVQKNNEDYSEAKFRYKFVDFIEKITKIVNDKPEAMEKQQVLQSKTKKRIILVTLPLSRVDNSLIMNMCKKFKIKIEYMYRQNDNEKLTDNILSILHMTPRLSMNKPNQNSIIVTYIPSQQKMIEISKELDDSNGISKSHIISFIKSPDKIKAMSLLADKICFFQKSLNEQNIEFERLKLVDQLPELIKSKFTRPKNQENQVSSDKQQQMNFSTQKTNKIYVIITMAIPGSGKTSIANKLQQMYQKKDIEFTILSSDKIRQKVIEKYRKQNPGMSSENIYVNTKKTGLLKYREALEAELKFQPQNSKVLFIDRVFCPTTIFQNLQQLNRKWVQTIIITQAQNNTKLNDHIYPLSVDHLLVCLKRTLQRQEHETLSAQPIEIIKVLLKFYQMYRDFTYNKLFNLIKQEKQMSVKFIGIQFTPEKEVSDGTNLHLKRKVEQCLKNIHPGHDAPHSEVYSELIGMIYTYTQHIERKKTQETQLEQQKKIYANCLKIIESIHIE